MARQRVTETKVWVSVTSTGKEHLDYFHLLCHLISNLLLAESKTYQHSEGPRCIINLGRQEKTRDVIKDIQANYSVDHGLLIFYSVFQDDK